MTGITIAQNVAPRSRAEQGYIIATGCPACGAPVEMAENLLTTQCEHCLSPLRLVRPKGEPSFTCFAKIARSEARFLLDSTCRRAGHALPPHGIAESLTYVPYRTVSGWILKTRNRIERREIVPENGDQQFSEIIETPRREVSLARFSVSVLAGREIDGLPANLGLRAEYLRVAPLEPTEENFEGRRLPVIESYEATLACVEKIVANQITISPAEFEKNRNRFFPFESVLLFYPYWQCEWFDESGLERWFIDAITGELFHAPLDTDDTLAVESDVNTNHLSGGVSTPVTVMLALHRCGMCGENLPLGHSYYYRCQTCGTDTMIDDSGHGDFAVQIVPVQTGGVGRVQFFPFWRITVRDRKLLPTLVPPMPEELFVPAFRIANAEALTRIVRRASYAACDIPLSQAGEGPFSHAPVEVSSEEALALLNLSLARIQEQDGQLHSKVEKGELSGPLFIPFREESYFFVDAVTGAITMEAGAIPSKKREPKGHSRV